MRSFVGPLISFFIAFSTMWWGFRTKSADVESRVASETRSKRERETAVTADQILAKHKKVTFDEAGWKVDRDREQERWNAENQRFKKLSESFQLGDDPAGQYAEAMKLFRSDPNRWAELRTVVLHWFRQDPAAYLSFHAGLPTEERDESCLAHALYSCCADHTMEKYLELSEHSLFLSQQMLRNEMIGAIVTKSLESGRFEDVASVMGRMSASFHKAFMSRLASNCPHDLKEQAYKWLVDQGESGLVAELAEKVVEAGRMTWNVPWLMEMIEKHPETKDALIQSGVYQKVMMHQWQQLPLEQRIDEMAMGSPNTGSLEEKRKKAVEYCCNTVANELIGQGSLSSEMAVGKIKTEAELVEKLGPQALALYERYPDALRKAVFPYWALSDPEAALDAVSHLSPKEQEQLVVHAASRAIVNQAGDSERLYRLFQAFPAKPDQGPLQARFSCWGYVSGKAYAEYGDSYVEWLRGLPHSVDRDMAMAALAQTIKGSDPVLSARLLVEKNQPGGAK